MTEGRRGEAALIGALTALILNAAYLAWRDDATLFYFANVLLHLALGVGLSVAGALLVYQRRVKLRAAPVTLACTGTALSGLALVVTGATRPYRWLLTAHVVLAVVAAGLLLRRLWPLIRQRAPVALARGLAIAAGAALVVPLVMGARQRMERHPRQAIVNPKQVPLAMDEEGAGPKSPFFPSSAETNVGGTIPATFFMTSTDCGRCHPDIYAQWRSSAHHFSSFNNQWYRKSIEYMQDVVGTKASKWCAGCHDHAVFFNGRFDRPIREQIKTPEAQNGLGCTSCHSIVHVKSTMGQGDFTIEYPPLHDLAVSDQPVLRTAHDYLLRLDPAPHRKTFLKDLHRQSAEFCSACHKVHLDVPVNGYRWLRGFNEYDNWQASGVSGQGARSFYYPPKSQTCTDCHMPLVLAKDPAARAGRVHSHRFPGANTALPFVNKDEEQQRVVEQFLRSGAVSVDVFGLVRGTPDEVAAAADQGGVRSEPRLASTFAVGEEALSAAGPGRVGGPAREVLAPLDRTAAAVRRGESARIEVVVRTRRVGHFFPGGTVDAFDVWVELEARDDRGRTIFHSGLVGQDGKGPVEAGAHFYRSLMLDEHGNPINKRNAWMTRSLAYVRLIPPGAADTVHYRLVVPPDCGDKLTLTARVNYRKFAWWNTQWAFAGVRDPAQKAFSLAPGHDDGRWVFTGSTADVSGEIKAIPDLPIVTLAEGQATLRVLPQGAPLSPARPYLDPSVRERWNDYGIGLLLQGDIRGAEAAFRKVTEMEPGYADGWVNVARAFLQEGNPAAAEGVLRKALTIDASLPKTRFFLGSALKSMGRYDEAEAQLRAVLVPFPRDRVVRDQLARVLFLKRRFAEAVSELTAVLAIDPEDLQAHYNLMLCYQGLGRVAEAERERRLYERFKADESAQFITGPYRRLHPADNNERQSIHEHVSALAPRPAYGAARRVAGR